MADDRRSSLACKACSSRDVEPLRVVEHERCGAVKPESAFYDADRAVCPKCEQECEGELTYVDQGELYRCRACGNRFDAATSVQTSADTSAFLTNDLWSGTDGDLITFSSGDRSRYRTVVSVVLLTLVVGSAVVTAVETAPMLEAESTSGHWEEYHSIVIFRNDDLQPYYEAEAMRAVDEVFAEQNASVTAGVIPAPGNMTLDSEMEFCSYLRERQREHPRTFEYALHGYHHVPLTEFHGSSEFGDVPVQRQRSMIRNGSRHFEACLGSQPDVFIPPRETYDNNTAQVLADEGFAAVSGGTWFTRAYYNETGQFQRRGILHLPSDGGLLKNWTTGEFYSLETLESQFDRAYRNESVYIQMIHYQHFTSQEKLDTLRGLIEHMESKGDVGFMTLGDFARKSANDRLERTEDGWRVWVEDQRDPVSVRTVVDHTVREIQRLLPGAVYWDRQEIIVQGVR